MKKIIGLVLVVVVAFFGFRLYLNKKNNEKVENQIKAEASKETAKLMISNFELAYNTAYMKNKTKPTLSMVAQEFNMESTESKLENGILKIKSDFGVECETKKEGQGIYLYCLLSNRKDSFKSNSFEIMS